MGNWAGGRTGGRTDGPNPFSQLSCQAICWTTATVCAPCLCFCCFDGGRFLPASPIYSPYPLLIPCGGGNGDRPAAAVPSLLVAQQVLKKKELAAAARKLVCFRLHDCQPNDDGLYIVTLACMHSAVENATFFSLLKTMYKS